eukprot:gene8845-11936_t
MYFASLIRPIQPNMLLITFKISFSYTFGFILTNWAFSIVSAGFAETIKSGEPISTVLIGLCFFREVSSLKTYLTLLPICAGVGLSCYHNDSFNLLGFLLAAGSNIFFSSRAVLAKMMAVSQPETFDELNLFSKISSIGLLFLLPITICTELNQIISYYRLNIYSRYDTNILLESSSQSLKSSSLGYLIGLLFINGIMFACYNLMSYVVLKKTDLLTHSVLNVFRRVFIIMITSAYFGLTISILNMIGIFVAVIGVMLFGYFKTGEKAKSYL